METPQTPTEVENQAKPTGAENQDGSTETPIPAVFEDGAEEPSDETPPEGTPPEGTPPEGTPPEGTPPGESSEQEPINQEAVNKRINKLAFEKHEERRKREKAEKEAEEAKARLAELEGKKGDIKVPDMPDPYDPEYQAKLAEREKALQAKAKADAALEAEQAREQERVKQAQEAAIQRYRKQEDAMFEGAEKVGITKEDIAKAAKTVSTFMNPVLAQFILARKDSALIVNHLATDIGELEKISQMDPLNASAYIAADVAPKAAGFKPSRPGAPAPLNIPDGAAARNEDPYLQGVTFE